MTPTPLCYLVFPLEFQSKVALVELASCYCDALDYVVESGIVVAVVMVVTVDVVDAVDVLVVVDAAFAAAEFAGFAYDIVAAVVVAAVTAATDVNYR